MDEESQPRKSKARTREDRPLTREDRARVEALFLAHGARIRAYAQFYVKSESAADDISQSVFCKVCRKAGDDPAWLRGAIENWDAWLTTATQNAALDWVRRATSMQRFVAGVVDRLRGSGAPVEDPAIEAPVDTVSRALALCRNDGDLVLQKALERLTPCERVALLCSVEGRAALDIAAQMRVSHHRVRTWLERAHQKFMAVTRRPPGHVPDLLVPEIVSPSDDSRAYEPPTPRAGNPDIALAPFGRAGQPPPATVETGLDAIAAPHPREMPQQDTHE